MSVDCEESGGVSQAWSLDEEAARRTAEDLAAKYGQDAAAFIHSCAARANAIGDELAYASLQLVLVAMRELLDRVPLPLA